MAEQFFIVGINVCKKSSFQLTRKIIPKFLLSPKKALESRKVRFNLYKENHQLQSKIPDVSFSIEFCFETKIGFVTRLCSFPHSYLSTYFLNLNDTIYIVARTPNSHMQRYFCHKHDAHNRNCLSILFCQLL